MSIQEIRVLPTTNELLSPEPSYLPFNFPGAPHHLPDESIERLLDTQFRLLRSELVDPLRAGLLGIAQQMKALTARDPDPSSYGSLAKLLRLGGGKFKFSAAASDLLIWGHGRLRFFVRTDARHGLLCNVKFLLPQEPKIRAAGLLGYGTLVAIVSDNDGAIKIDLAVVRSDKVGVKELEPNKWQVSVRVELLSDTTIGDLMRLSLGAQRQVLVEVPDVWYEAVAPFLSCLKLADPQRFPFKEVLPVVKAGPRGYNIDLGPPHYTDKSGFSFDLSALLREPGDTKAPSHLLMKVDDDSVRHARQALKQYGMVDESQADAVIDSLTRKVAIIQGPPGTGKSYTGVAILKTLVRSGAGPILIVSTTNHALDGILCKVLDSRATDKIVRLGSRVSDERLEKFSLQKLVKKRKLRGSKPLWEAYREVEASINNLGTKLKRTGGASESALLQLDRFCHQLADIHRQIKYLRLNKWLAVLQGAQIIGATASGAARASALLKAVRPRVVLVEEAGQVLESHLLATLIPSIEHLILIGDHDQLRPQISSMHLSVEHANGGHLHRMDMSTMERLAEESGLPLSRIVTQRRMRLEICDVIRSVGKLQDDPSVLGREDIRGMPSNVLFLDHQHADGPKGTSRINKSEAAMTVDLVRHLLKQGYSGPQEICVIVAYNSQIPMLRERLGECGILCTDEAHPPADQASLLLKPTVRLATIDSVQGEEAKIVIVSLVRNEGPESQNGKAAGIGFLKTTNRAYVALSRARDGLYVFGNAHQLRSHSSFWAGVLDVFEKQKAIVRMTNGSPGAMLERIAALAEVST
ncbi:hypothetical protein V8E36_003572 [Tilletia maclaganii]